MWSPRLWRELKFCKKNAIKTQLLNLLKWIFSGKTFTLPCLMSWQMYYTGYHDFTSIKVYLRLKYYLHLFVKICNKSYGRTYGEEELCILVLFIPRLTIEAVSCEALSSHLWPALGKTMHWWAIIAFMIHL